VKAIEAPTFVYIDYGASPQIARELRYSLATLLAEYAAPRVVVYTDKPQFYARLHPCVTPRPLGGDLGRWTREGAYNHRIKPCVLLDALRDNAGLSVLIDTDSWIEPGFATALSRATANGPAMDQFEKRDPYPEIAGFSACLPNAGAYVYTPDTAIMFNSGLIAARDGAAVEDAIALIDAMWDAGRRLFKIEQIAVSEAFRAHGAVIGETYPAFRHYFRRSLKRYMHWRIDAWVKQTPDFLPTRPCISAPRNAVRVFNWVDRATGRMFSGDRLEDAIK
jgi:hypothetical protein